MFPLEFLREKYFVTVLVAATAPFLGLVIALVGALCVSALAIVFPALADMCVNWEDEKRGACLIIRNVFIILFGFVGLISGTYASLYGIVFESTKPGKEEELFFS